MQRTHNVPTKLDATIQNSDGVWTKIDKETTCIFVNHLKNVFLSKSSNKQFSTCRKCTLAPPTNIEFKICVVVCEIKEPDINKTFGKDIISSQMVKELPSVAVKLLVRIFNSILNNKKFF